MAKAKYVPTVREVIDSDAKYEFDGCTLAEILENVKRMIAEHGPDAAIDIDLVDDWGGDQRINVELYKYRPENDAEKAKRLRQDEAKEKRERAQYERLQRKFG